jgi:soluble lytic murein transglycosylase
MRGVGRTFSRLPAARALIAGAAILAGSMPAGVAQGLPSSEDTAMAVPRVAPMLPGGHSDGANLPEPLPPSDALRIRQIFALQARGEMTEAAAQLAQVGNTMLNGHILADRYLGRFAQASASELATWLARYPDHPDASAVHTALLARLPRGTPAPPAPPAPPDLGASTAATPEEDEPAEHRLVRNPLLDRTVRERARAGNADSALHLLTRTRGLDALYGSQLRAEIARALFTQGRDAEALHLAESALHQSQGRVGLAGYVAGLAAWRLERTDLAQPLFEQASRAELAPAALRAGAAFWAARAHLRNRDPAGYAPWMRRAGDARRTFYGLLARRTLGLGTDLAPSRETLGSADIDALVATPQGLCAFALLQVGQSRRAEAELRSLWPATQGNPALGGSILRVAGAAGMTDFAAQLAGLMQSADGRPHDDARFPIPTLRPTGGFRMDPALVYALTRLESNFDPDAVSGAGARGLMQIMPVTASYMTGNDSSAAGFYARRLHDPATNLSVGQSYVMYLAQHDLVGGDLIHLLGSYNAGPTSFARMAGGIRAADDPLLFIESIPNDETRGFVPRALAYTWIYAARLRLPAPSLDELAAGAWPAFHAQPPRHEAAARLH